MYLDLMSFSLKKKKNREIFFVNSHINVKYNSKYFFFHKVNPLTDLTLSKKFFWEKILRIRFYKVSLSYLKFFCSFFRKNTRKLDKIIKNPFLIFDFLFLSININLKPLAKFKIVYESCATGPEKQCRPISI